MRLAILFIVAFGSGVAFAQSTPPILQEPQTIPLWQGRAPGALGDAPRGCSHADDLHAAKHDGPDDRCHRGARRRLSRAVDEQRRPDSRELSQLARHRGVRAEVPPRSELSASHRAWRHAAGDSHAAIACGGMASCAGPHRRHGLFGRRPSRIDGVHAVRSRQRSVGRCDRSRQQPARFRDPRLSGDLAVGAVDPSGIQDHACSERTQRSHWRVAFRPIRW